MNKLLLLVTLVLSASCAKPNNYLYPVPSPLPQRKVDPGPPGALHGVVTNAVNGFALPGVSVVLHDSTGVVLSTSLTAGDGTYDIQRLDQGPYTLDFTLLGFVPITGAQVTIVSAQTTTLSESMTTILAASQYRIILNWTGPKDGAVRDVDSYLQIPGFESTPIGYTNRDFGQGANLDHDDTQWLGPETITITNLQQGTYTYYVNNFNVRCDYAALAKSDVTIRLYQGANLLRTYTIPEGGMGITWVPFMIVNGQVVDVNEYRDYLPTYGGGFLCDRTVIPRNTHR